jgi:hypothetical protein
MPIQINVKYINQALQERNRRTTMTTITATKSLFGLPKTKVYELSITKRNLISCRQSNRTILVPTYVLSDSDRLTLEDKYGHRYSRNIALETDIGTRQKSEPYYIFEIY